MIARSIPCIDVPESKSGVETMKQLERNLGEFRILDLVESRKYISKHAHGVARTIPAEPRNWCDFLVKGTGSMAQLLALCPTSTRVLGCPRSPLL
jgi:hypothetical protein